MSLPIKFRQMLVVFIFGTVAIAVASLAFAYQASLIPASRLVNPDELVKILQSAKSEKPLMIQVGSCHDQPQCRLFLSFENLRTGQTSWLCGC